MFRKSIAVVFVLFLIANVLAACGGDRGGQKVGIEVVADFQQPVIDGVEVIGYGAAAFRKEDVELRDAFNAELEKLKQSGELLELLEQNGFSETELPDERTMEQLCDGNHQPLGGGDTLQRALETGTITIGYANEKPYAYEENGEMRGEAIDIATTIFHRLGIENVEGQLVAWDTLIPGLQAGRFDVITAGMYITPERCQQVIFAEPEYKIGEALAVAEGNPHQLYSYEDIAANPDVTIAVMQGAIEVEYLLAAGVSQNQIQQVPDQAAALAALESGRVDAITMTTLSMKSILESAGYTGD